MKSKYVRMTEGATEGYNIRFQSHLYATFQMNTLKYMLESGERFTAEEMMREFRKFYSTAFAAAGIENSGEKRE